MTPEQAAALRALADEADTRAQALLTDTGYRSDGLDLSAERHYWLRTRDWLRARAEEVNP